MKYDNQMGELYSHECLFSSNIPGQFTSVLRSLTIGTSERAGSLETQVPGSRSSVIFHYWYFTTNYLTNNTSGTNVNQINKLNALLIRL